MTNDERGALVSAIQRLAYISNGGALDLVDKFDESGAAQVMLGVCEEVSKKQAEEEAAQRDIYPSMAGNY